MQISRQVEVCCYVGAILGVKIDSSAPAAKCLNR